MDGAPVVVAEAGVAELREIERHRVVGVLFVQYRWPGAAADTFLRLEVALEAAEFDPAPDFRRLSPAELEAWLWERAGAIVRRMTDPSGGVRRPT